MLDRVLRRLPGVIDVYVNPVTELAYIDFDPGSAPDAADARKQPLPDREALRDHEGW